MKKRYPHRITKRERAAVDVLYTPISQNGGVLPKQLALPRFIPELNAVHQRTTAAAKERTLQTESP